MRAKRKVCTIQPFAHQQPIDAGETKSAGLQTSTFLQVAHQCADGQAGLLQAQLDDRLGCLWAERPTDSFVPATLALQRPKTLCSPLIEPALERARRGAPPIPV